MIISKKAVFLIFFTEIQTDMEILNNFRVFIWLVNMMNVKDKTITKKLGIVIASFKDQYLLKNT